jgi:DNA-binding response OmpR family regulator
VNPPAPAWSRPRRVLLVEDNPADARLVQESLRTPAFPDLAVDVVSRLSEALTRLSGEAYTVVLLDLGLPDSQGLGTAIRLLEAFPQVPVVVLTGLEDERVGVLAVQEGAQDYLVKGQVAVPALRRAIEYAILRQDMLSHAAGGAQSAERQGPADGGPEA